MRAAQGLLNQIAINCALTSFIQLCCDLDADEPIRYHVRGFFEDVGVEKLTITLITSLQVWINFM